MTVFRWIIHGLLALEAIGMVQLLLRDGGKEADAWLILLTLPLILIMLAAVYLVNSAVLKQ